MTPKEKAIELVNEFQPISGHIRFSKAYALITVRVIIKSVDYMDIPYWEAVKQEIEKL